MISAAECDAILLAAGLSSRMGRNKMLVRIGETPLVRLATLHALEACRRVIIVTGNEEDAVYAAVSDLERVVRVHNEHYSEGMFGSIQMGMTRVETDWFFVVPGDLPSIDTPIFEHVAGAVDDSRAALDGGRVPSGGEAPNPGAEAGRVRAIVPYYREIRGHPVLLHRSLIPALLDEPRDAGPMRRLVARHPVRRLSVDRSEIICDVDTPADLPVSDLAAAAHDYRWLLDRGYPDEPALKLTGDRYRLSRTDRATLYRGVFSTKDSLRRVSRVEQRQVMPADARLLVDGHNVLLTVWNALSGRPVVRATDGFIRDIGGTRARLPHDERFARVARLVLDTAVALAPSELTILLDEPLPWSREHAAELRRLWEQVASDSDAPTGALQISVRTERSVDAVVAAETRGFIATSDTAIVDRSPVTVIDLGGRVVASRLSLKLLDMSVLIRGRGAEDPPS